MFHIHKWDKVTEETDEYYWEFKYCNKCRSSKAHCRAKVSKKLAIKWTKWVDKVKKALIVGEVS